MIRNWLKNVYRNLPVIHELRRIQAELFHLREVGQRSESRLRSIECSSILRALYAVQTNEADFDNPKRLLSHGAQYWSQNYEDGMIAEIFRRISVTTSTFVEIGVETGKETNTTALLAQGWSGWWFEGNPEFCQMIRESLEKMDSMKSRLRVSEGFVTPNNIARKFTEAGVPKEVDLFSLDIDLDTYHIWHALTEFRPRVVVVEYNAAIPESVEWVHPYSEAKWWDGTQAFGASLKAFENLGRNLGYSLVGCDIIGINAFFVRDDLLGTSFCQPFSSENHYQPPRYWLCYRRAHPSKLFGESHVE